ncbi:MAG: LPXTG cell wall anchor domain-containing protein [Promethearchaeota archaeon]|nr:MAG: LPXTG cell wall anchor domain-containing protein [Candidatus Lokiarchaeota archaeon]
MIFIVIGILVALGYFIYRRRKI